MKSTLSIQGIPGIVGRLSGVLSTLFPEGEPQAKFAAGRSAPSPEAPPGPPAIVLGSLPDGFVAFTPKEITDARSLFAKIRADHAEIMTLTETEVRRAYKRNPGGIEDAALAGRIEQAARLRSAVKQRRREHCTQLGAVLAPGLKRAADAMRQTADAFENAERAMAARMGIEYQDGCVVRAIRTAETLLRDSAKHGGAGAARSLADGTFGLIPN